MDKANKKFEYLYQIIYDDLKDADMIIHYAYELKDCPEDKMLADELAKYAKFRLDHAMEAHKWFVTAFEEATEGQKENVTFCLWEQTHKYAMEWYEKIADKIKKY